MRRKRTTPVARSRKTYLRQIEKIGRPIASHRGDPTISMQTAIIGSRPPAAGRGVKSGGGELARAIDRQMLGAGDRRALIGDDQRVDIDEQMALMLVIAGDAGAHAERVADPRCSEMLDLAADMHP